MPPFSTVLIANRGEIAVRIIRAVREAGLQTIAIYSAADASALHVRLADAAYPVGPAPATESYLCGERIIDLARRVGAEALHPGYGFLSENADFAAACQDAGLVWIGPPPAAMRLLGDKAAAKALAEQSGVPTLQGYHGALRDDESLRAAADELGYPLLVKAAAGGGGRGMRLVTDGSELGEALVSARREARTAFGDDRLLLERYLQRPRHVEMQIVLDEHGGVLYLGERDCSVQRRHQKIVEESPAPGFSSQQREAMGEAALSLARAAQYVNAGTCEFLVDTRGAFYFLEVNARLQVEHPVTEMVSGLDLVQLQLSVARGDPLPLVQSDVQLEGHAIECRLYAEDPGSGFLPSAGRLERFELPSQPSGGSLRVDSGVEAGDVVSPHYDPLLAKLVVWAPDRRRAVAAMLDAVQHTEVAGVRTNRSLLEAVIASQEFAQAELHTAFVEQHGLAAPSSPPDELLIAAAAGELVWAEQRTTGYRDGAIRRGGIWSMLGPWRPARVGVEARYVHDDTLYSVTVEPGIAPSDPWSFGLAERTAQVRVRPASYPWIGLERDGRVVQVSVESRGNLRVVRAGRRVLRLRVASGLETRRRGGAHAHTAAREAIIAPMPGRVVKLLVEPGDQVKRSQSLIVMEAMKIEHLVLAPHDGIVDAIHCAPGDQVEAGALLVELED